MAKDSIEHAVEVILYERLKLREYIRTMKRQMNEICQSIEIEEEVEQLAQIDAGLDLLQGRYERENAHILAEQIAERVCEEYRHIEFPSKPLISLIANTILDSRGER